MRLFDGMPITPENDEEAKQCETPDGIRARLNRCAYRGNEPLLKAVYDMAEIRGLSGEDKMTILAFEALKQLERYKTILLEQAMFSPGPLLFTADKEPS